MGAAIPTWSYVGRHPIEKVDTAIIISETNTAARRLGSNITKATHRIVLNQTGSSVPNAVQQSYLTRSPKIPNKTPPIGRIKKAPAKTPNASIMFARGSSGGKNRAPNSGANAL